MVRKVLFLLTLLAVASAYAETVYISDELTVPLRRGPSNGHKIIDAALPAGTSLEVLSEDKAAGFTQVRTQSGTDGWVPTQYLTNTPIAKDQLASANKRVQALEAELKSVRQNFQETRGARAEAETRGADLDKQTKQLQAELAELKRVSATSIAQYEENKQLKIENQELHTQVNDLSSKVTSLQHNTQLRWLLGGGALVLLGLMLGTWIKSRPKRSSWA
ncbi:MAG TPA: TIGR04211 family SH3 domain-containing protein [Steroidobacteraceae bacterium]